MTTIDVDIRRTTGSPLVRIWAATNIVAPAPLRGGVPLTMSSDDRLFWSLKWRADTRESERARAEGRSVVFDSDDPLDVVRWLFSE